MNAPASIQVYEGSNVTTVARVTLPNGASMFASYIDPDPSILLYVYDITDGSTTATASYNSNGSGGHSADGNLEHDTAVKTEDTNDRYWTVDSTGYNFFLKIPVGATFPGGQRYRIEFQLILTAATDSAHGSLGMGTVRWASIIYVKPMVS